MQSKSVVLWMVCLLVIVSGFAGLAPTSQVIAHRADGVEPIWVPASEASKDGRTLDSKLLPGLSYLIDNVLSPDPERGCYEFGPSEYSGVVGEGGFAEGSLADLQANARVIVTGRVVGETPGFYAQQPGTLLQVAVEGVLKRTSAYEIGSTGPEDAAVLMHREGRKWREIKA